MGADTSQLKGNPSALQHKDLQSLSNLTPGYILKLKERFESSSEDYNLTKQGLKDFFKCRDNEVDVIFKLFDQDGNGSIDSYEFVCALSMMSHATLNEKAELIFNLYDFDRSQSISKDELTVLMTNALSALKNMEGKPAPTIAEIEQKTNQFFKEADEDRNNQISLREFKSYVKRDKQCLEVLTSFGVAQKSDLGTDFGSGDTSVPDVDSDLDEECNPKALNRSDRQNMVKSGLRGEFAEEDLGEGDQATPGLSGVINNSVPDSYKPSRRDGEAPEASLDLEYVYGIRCHDVRNNLRYNADGKLIYNCAGVGVVMDKKTNTQRHFMSHGDDIHCCAVDPSGVLVATGEIGPHPRFSIWNSKTLEEVFTTTAPMVKGIKHVAFSRDGRFVACSDMSDDHNLYIFDVKTKLKTGQAWTPIAGGKGTRANIMSLGWNATSDVVIATAVKQVCFFTFANGQLRNSKGTGWGTQPADTVLTQAVCGNTLFTGHHTGEIISWTGSSISKRTKCHAAKVSSLYTNEAGTILISGGGDGVVSTWTVSGTNITKIKDFNIKAPELMSMNGAVTSVCESKAGDTLLVATRGGEIFEFNQSTGKASVYLRGHFDLELWGLATHPTQPEIYTWGQDAMLAVWDLKTRRQKKHCKLESGGDAIAFSNNAKYLVLGFLNGTMLVLDANFGAVTKRRDRAGKAIQVIKFSPDDRICAAGGHDQLIMTYDVTKNFKPMRKLRGHHTTIWQMDFSLDSNVLIHDGLMFYDVASGKHNPRGASAYKNETWATWTLRQGWPVQGIFPPCAMVNDVNSVDRSPDGQVLATGDDFGFVKLFKFPSPVPKASYQKFTGHSSHVTNVQFTKNKQGQPYLISTGGNDKCIFQWKYLCDENAIRANDVAEELELKALDDGYAKDPDSSQASVQDQPRNEFDEEDLGEGDQALAVKPFLGQVKAMTPTGFKPARTAGQAPDNNLRLKWAHGFRSFDTRNNLKYTAEGQVLFTTAGVGVVQNLQRNTQEFFNLHKEDIVAMALHPDKDIVATGQMAGKELNEQTVGRRKAGDKLERKESKQGKLVTIYIWRASTREVVAKIFGFHRRAVRQLAFSPSGKKLLSIGEDDQHSVAVYDWASQSKLADASVDLAQVYDAKWSNDENLFATCGLKHMKIFRQNGQNLQGSQCNYRALGQGAQLTSVQYVLNNQLVSGSSSGELVPWNGNSMGKPIKAHDAPIWCIEKGANNSFYTGSHDGKVIMWNTQMQAARTIDIKSLVTWQPECGLRSLDIQSDGTLLVGTRGSDVLEVSPQGALVRKVVQGHFKGVKDLPEVWGCATHPTEQIFATTGADLCVRLWHENKMVAVSQQLPADPTACDWSGCGKFLAIGDRKGDCTIMDAKSLQIIGSIKSTLSGKKAAWVEDIKFSPDSTRVAFGTHGGNSKLEFVTVNAQGKPTKIDKSKVAISSALICLDWSQDGQVVVVNSQSYELLFIDSSSLKMVNASNVKETIWQTWTCRFGFASQGIWPGVDYTDVNSVDRSRNGQLLATGDDFGMVKLFKYPCVVEKAESHEYAGHSSHVTKVKFSAGDRFVVSTGGNDMTVMIWETDVNAGVAQDQSEIPDYEDSLDDPSHESKKDLARLQREKAKIDRKEKEQALLHASKQQANEFDDFAEQDLGAGDEFLAVRPWTGQMKPPSTFKRAAKGANLAPAVELQLEWVHGYKGDSVKNNLKYLDDGQLAYYIAAVGVVYNPETHTQKHFQLHTDDITAMDFHPDNRTVATGENGKRPKAYVWDTQTMQKIHQFVGHGIVETIVAMAFSPSGKHLALVAGNQDHNVAVYDIVSGACVAESKGPKEMVTQVRWENDQSFALVGAKLFYLFTINAKSFTKKRGNFAGHDQRIGSAAYNGSTCLTGAITGELYSWSGTSVVGVPKKLHARLIDAITVTDTHVFTGARDSKITVMDKQLNVKFTIDLVPIKDSNSTQVKAITLNKRQDRMIVGTFGHEIIELPISLQMNTCDVSQAKILIHGHFAPMTTYTNEVWGLAIFPNQDKYATCSDDAKLKIWDTATRKQIKSIPLNLDKTGKPIPLDPNWKDLAPASQGRSIDVSPRGDLIAVGMRDGTMRIFQTSTWKMVHLQKCGNEWIEDLKFSPDGKYLAVGGHDNQLYVFSMPDCKLLGKKFGVSSSFITHLDWSIDSQSIRTNDGSYELLYYNVQDGKQLTSGATQFRDEPWATQSCVLGWATQGIWQAGQDGSDINHCDRSHRPICDQQQLMATADDSGMVNLYKFPSPIEKSKAVQGSGHSSHVTKVRFSHKDTHLFSTGGNDTAVMQWRIVVPK